jgi:hypothetical protein
LLVVLDLVRSDRLGHEPWALDFGDYFDLNMLVTVRKKQLRHNSARKGAALWFARRAAHTPWQGFDKRRPGRCSCRVL